MNNKLKPAFLLILLISFKSFGQINDLSMMGIEADDFINQTPNPDLDPGYREREKPENMIDEEAQREEFKDREYGYSGGETFNNPPKSRIS